MNLPILEFLFQCYFLYKRHTHFSTLSVYTVIFNPIIITWYTLYTTINCTPFYITILLQWYSTNMSHIKQTTYLIYRSSFYAFYMRFSPLIRLKKHKLDQIESFGRIFVTQECEKSKSLI